MNIYMIVEGKETEMFVYPAWLNILSPKMKRIENEEELSGNNYYIFCGCGIPSIYDHVVNAVQNINSINQTGPNHYDYLVVCLDTEEEGREYILKRIQEKLLEQAIIPKDFEIRVFEQKVCMESWLLANRKIFKSNPRGQEMQSFKRFYDVKLQNPEDMPSIDPNRFTKAQFHFRYLKRMLEERNMRYDKNNPSEVCDEDYLNELISRYKDTGHIKTFGAWFDFVLNRLR